MSGGSTAHQLETLLLLLVFVAGFSGLARRWSVPYPIVLVVAGLVLSFIPGIPRIPLSPDVVFFILLPPLLYSAAYLTSWRDFRYNLVSIAMLAFGLVGFTVWGVAYTADHLITALDWKSGFLLGAVVSATDAIAATSIAKTLGLPRRIVDVLEGESLLNDATALLALEFGLLFLLRGKLPSAGEGLLRLAWLTAGGIGVGLALGAVEAWFERFVNDGPIEIVISLIVPYAAYLAGNAVHASGVLATVACGLYIGRRSSTIYSPTARLQLRAVWQAMTFAMNGLVFVLIGLQLPYVLAGIRGYGRWTLLLYAAIFSGVLIALRMIWTFPGAWFAFWIRTRLLKQQQTPPTARGLFVVGWTGMRGVVALAAAFSLPETLADGRPFEQRNLIIFLTFSVILVTLVLQGSTLPALIRVLGLAGRGGMATEEREVRRTVIEEGLAKLRSDRERASVDEAQIYDDLIHQYEHRLAAVSGSGGPAHKESRGNFERIVHSVEQTERNTLIRLRDEGQISDQVLRAVERDLDLTASHHHSRP
ncbi:Na+/H+ antiporter [Edaphobacter sp. HDX4]|uniref:Na+/H+ antiporter n=1 Tax=Edaphobacter sp. HDX4 TaxID=2794064 RepID=UPI002FE61495